MCCREECCVLASGAQRSCVGGGAQPLAEGPSGRRCCSGRGVKVCACVLVSGRLGFPGAMLQASSFATVVVHGDDAF